MTCRTVDFGIRTTSFSCRWRSICHWSSSCYVQIVCCTKRSSRSESWGILGREESAYAAAIWLVKTHSGSFPAGMKIILVCIAMSDTYTGCSNRSCCNAKCDDSRRKLHVAEVRLWGRQLIAEIDFPGKAFCTWERGDSDWSKHSHINKWYIYLSPSISILPA